MESNTNSIAKVAAIVAASALVAMSFAGGTLAHAQTTTTTTMSSSQEATLEAQIASLQAQLAAATGTTAMASVTFTRDLTIGSTGSDVTALQTWLIAKGFTISAGATGYFGTQTRAALAAYQAANGITPAAGYFGPITRAKVNASGSTTTTTTTTTTGGTTTTTGTTTALSGGEGSINNFQTVGASNVTLGTGANQQVYGFQFMAGGSDLEINRIYYAISNPNIGVGTTRPWNVFSTATLTDGSGNTVATLDASNQNNYSEDGTLANGNQVYRLDFENVNQVVKEGATQSYFLTLSTQSAFASGNVTTSGTQFDVGLDSQGLRATDAMGLQQYSPAEAVGAGSVVNINQNTSGSVTLSTASDNPQTTTLMANQNTATQNVVLNTFTLDNTGSASIELYTLPVTLITTTGTTTMATSSNLVQDLKLYNGSTLLDTESPSSTFTSGSQLSFKNINLVIPAGTTDHFSVEADVQPVGLNNPAPSQSTAQVNVTGTGSDIESSGGSILTVSGSATGYPISFAVNGLSIASNPTTATATAVLTNGTGSTQTGTFTFTFNVTAFGQSIYVGSTSEAYVLTLIDPNGNATSTTGSAITSSANRSPLGNWLVNSGQTAAFTISATKTGGNAYVYAVLKSLSYGTTDSVTGSATTTLPSTYTTNAVYLSS
jgi:peptidoglycan hydrolase-like protein with peptidoglycan-binding domain